MDLKNLTFSMTLTAVISAVSTPLFAKDLLPIDLGTYVQTQRDCSDPQKSMPFIYDGDTVKSSKTACSLRNVTNTGNIYRYEEKCSYYHRSWSILPTTTTEFKTTLEVLNRREFRLKRQHADSEINDHYRWCAPQ